jgi:hypothetical protein
VQQLNQIVADAVARAGAAGFTIDQLLEQLRNWPDRPSSKEKE